jgi:type VII secretion protein EccE
MFRMGLPLFSVKRELFRSMTQMSAPPRKVDDQHQGINTLVDSMVTAKHIGRFRPVGIRQIMLWEIAAVIVVACWFPPRLASWIVLGAGIVVIAVTSVRFDGLCGYQWAGVYRRFRARRHPGGDPLQAMVPGLRISQHIDRAGNRAGVAKVDDSFVAVVRVAPSLPVSPSVLLGLLRKAYDRTDIRLCAAELVTWSVPSPPRARYYGDERDTQPLQIHWLALRYQPSLAPSAALARGGGDTGGVRAVASAAIALVSEVAKLGLPAVVLDQNDLRQELFVALGVGNPAGVKITETWQDFSFGPVRQIGFGTRQGKDDLTVLGRWVAGAAFTATSLTLYRDQRGRVRASGLIRIGARATDGKMTIRQVSKALGVRLTTRNGRQELAMRGTLPLAL